MTQNLISLRKILLSIFTILISVTIFVTILPISSNAAELVIVIDPGHGGSDPGACSTVNGISYQEKTLNLKISLATRDYLQNNFSGIRVEMTRTDDGTSLTLAQRVSKANKLGAHALISIHNNSSSYTSAGGTEVIVADSNYRPEITQATKDMGNAILKHTTQLGLKNRGTLTKLATTGSYIVYYPDGSQQDYYGIVQRSIRAGFPGIIVESAFISNEQDVTNFLSTDEKLESLGIAIGKGIAEYYGLSTDKTYDTTARVPIDAQKLTFSRDAHAKLAYPLGHTQRTAEDDGVRLSSSNSAPATLIDYMGMALNANDNKCAVITMKASYDGAKLSVFCGSDEIVTPDSDYCVEGTLSSDYKHYLIDFTTLPGWDMAINLLQFNVNGAESFWLKEIEFFPNVASVPYSDTVNLTRATTPVITQTPTLQTTPAPTSTPSPTEEPTLCPTPNETPTDAPSQTATGGPVIKDDATDVPETLPTDTVSITPSEDEQSPVKTVITALAVVAVIALALSATYIALVRLTKNSK